MRRWERNALISVATVILFTLAWSVADCFLFEDRVRELFRRVEHIQVGSPIDQVVWMKWEYLPLASDEDFSGNIELQAYRTKLDYLHYPLNIVPRKLLMRDAVAGGAIEVKNFKLVSGKVIGISSGFDENGSPKKNTDVVEGNLLYPPSPVELIAHREGFDVVQTKFGTKIIVAPEASARQKDTAYRVDFHCLWRWNRCKEGAETTHGSA